MFDLAPAPALVRSRPRRQLEDAIRAAGLSCRTNQPPRRPLDFPESSFLPTNLAGMVAWYRADLGVSDSGGGTASAWANQIPGDPNTNLVQPAGAQQPFIQAASAAYNNQAVLVFDGTVTNMPSAAAWAAPLAQPFTIFAVGDNGNLGANDVCIVDTLVGGGERALYAFTDIPGAYFGAAVNNAGKSWSNPNALVATIDGVSSNEFFSSKTATATGNLGAGGITGLMAGAYYGAPAAGTYNWFGSIAEIGVYNRILTAPEVSQLLDYLGTRYAIAILP